MYLSSNGPCQPTVSPYLSQASLLWTGLRDLPDLLTVPSIAVLALARRDETADAYLDDGDEAPNGRLLEPAVGREDHCEQRAREDEQERGLEALGGRDADNGAEHEQRVQALAAEQIRGPRQREGPCEVHRPLVPARRPSGSSAHAAGELWTARARARI